MPRTKPISKGCVIAAPHSGAGKTLFTLGLIRALKNRGEEVASAKVGPDFIDPAFHKAAGGQDCINLDLWAMGKETVRTLAATLSKSGDTIIIEGVMGLFDGADDGNGSTADLAKTLNLPVILIVDASRQSWSVAALLHGFTTFDPDVEIAGVIFNKVASPRHEMLLRRACEPLDIHVLGVLHRVDDLILPSRHLGLVQATEHRELDAFIEKTAQQIEESIDIDQLQAVRAEIETTTIDNDILPPLAQHIAIANDEAFSFLYPHLVQSWQKQGATISFFSPLADEAPSEDAEAIYLPGGYPELHAGKLAANNTFMTGLRNHRDESLIYGECGGYMIMGKALIDADGTSHEMANLLPVVTSFEHPKRKLGYRSLTHDSALPWPKRLRGHEFHYSDAVTKTDAPTLFQAQNASGDELPDMGMTLGRVMGSYAHVISKAPDEAQ